MRLPRVRVTVRQMMVLVAYFGLQVALVVGIARSFKGEPDAADWANATICSMAAQFVLSVPIFIAIALYRLIRRYRGFNRNEAGPTVGRDAHLPVSITTSR